MIFITTMEWFHILLIIISIENFFHRNHLDMSLLYWLLFKCFLWDILLKLILDMSTLSYNVSPTIIIIIDIQISHVKIQHCRHGKQMPVTWSHMLGSHFDFITWILGFSWSCLKRSFRLDIFVLWYKYELYVQKILDDSLSGHNVHIGTINIHKEPLHFNPVQKSLCCPNWHNKDS